MREYDFRQKVLQRNTATSGGTPVNLKRQDE